VQRYRRLPHALLPVAALAAHVSKKCISRQEHPLCAQLELVVRLLLRVLVMRQMVMQAGIRLSLLAL
jgi:hypothetical protein